VNVIRLVETTSTNDEAKRGAREGAAHLTVWSTESQTAGRGRQGRSWSSPRGENLLFSVLLRITCLPARVPLVALVAGLAVRDAVAKHLSSTRADDVKVKWPNDVLVGDKKIAGILVESSIRGTKVDHVVVGIGVNVHTRNFPDDLAPFATSISLEGGQCDRDALLEAIVENLDHDVEHVVHRGLGLVHARLERADYLRGRDLEGDLGRAEGIDDDGRLLVRKPDGVLVRLSSGEIRARPHAGA
jgi:BirA family transcriptional regulator, biotin operon repressor / biotin---[acetyl-CoA-carboxylase] ligase